MQGVGFTRSTDETSNDGGGKGWTYKPLRIQNIYRTGGGKEMGNAYERIAEQMNMKRYRR